MKTALSDCRATLCISPGQLTRCRLVQSLCLSSSPRSTKRPWSMLDFVGDVQTSTDSAGPEKGSPQQWKHHGLGLGAGSYRQSSLALFLWDGHRNYHNEAQHRPIHCGRAWWGSSPSRRAPVTLWPFQRTGVTRSKLQLIARPASGFVAGFEWGRERQLWATQWGFVILQCMWIVLYRVKAMLVLAFAA